MKVHDKAALWDKFARAAEVVVGEDGDVYVSLWMGDMHGEAILGLTPEDHAAIATGRPFTLATDEIIANIVKARTT